MEDFIEILLYVVLAIAGIIGSIVKNSKTKKDLEAQKARNEEKMKQQEQNPQSGGSQMSQQTNPTVEGNPFEEFLRRQLVENEEPEEELLLDEDNQETLSGTQTKLDTVVPEGTAAFKSTSDSILSDSLKDEKSSITESLVDNTSNIYNFSYSDITDGVSPDLIDGYSFFDAKKAVIYTEILKRPDF